LIILDGPLSNDETKTAMIVFAPNSSVGNTEPVTFLQLDAETNACPVGYCKYTLRVIK
jgi:RAB protein geranylgeranyltransferase component A